MHLLLSLVLAFQLGSDTLLDPVCRAMVRHGNRPQPALEDFDHVDLGVGRAIPATDVSKRDAESHF